jgi:sortase A
MTRVTKRARALALAAAGLVALVWVLVVWIWRDPFTSAYTLWKQRGLNDRYEALVAEAPPVGRKDVPRTAARFRATSRPGDPIAKLRVPRLDLELVVLEGTDPATLRAGPGRDPRSWMPGEGKLVYLAGHRTTYLAPFAEIQRLRPGDPIELRLPYGLFRYEVTGHRIVAPDDLSVLRAPKRETLRLQACHPRFFASERYVVTARLVGIEATLKAAPRRAPGSGAAGLRPASARETAAART